jgi:hypothetical protein
VVRGASGILGGARLAGGSALGLQQTGGVGFLGDKPDPLLQGAFTLPLGLLLHLDTILANLDFFLAHPTLWAATLLQKL